MEKFIEITELPSIPSLRSKSKVLRINLSKQNILSVVSPLFIELMHWNCFQKFKIFFYSILSVNGNLQIKN